MKFFIHVYDIITEEGLHITPQKSVTYLSVFNTSLTILIYRQNQYKIPIIPSQ